MTEEKVARLDEADHIEYFLESLYSTPSGKTHGYVSRERMFSSGYGFPITKQHPLGDIFDKK